MKIVVLMGGDAPEDVLGAYPFYMTEFNEKMILEQQIEYCKNIDPSQIIFCLKSSDIKNYHIDSVISQCADRVAIVTINNKTAGSVCTALLASEYINSDEEVVFMAIDDFIDEDGGKIISRFREKNLDAGVVSFRSVHPRYSFAKINVDGLVSEVAEKQPISKNALASFYYFKNGSDFLTAAKSVIEKDNKINGAFYISQTLNELILNQKSVGMYQISNDKFHPLKSKLQLAQYMCDLKDRQESK